MKGAVGIKTAEARHMRVAHTLDTIINMLERHVTDKELDSEMHDALTGLQLLARMTHRQNAGKIRVLKRWEENAR